MKAETMVKIMEATSPEDYVDIANEDLIEGLMTIKAVLFVFKNDVCPECKKYIQSHLMTIYRSLPNMN